MSLDLDRDDTPLFDAHVHFSQAYLDSVLHSFSACGVRGGINLWGAAQGFLTYSADYAEYLALIKRRTGGAFVSFYWPDWTRFGWDAERFVPALLRDMERYAALGCRGLKVWKDLGMFMIHPDGRPATMDDPRLEPVWRKAADLNWVVAVHQADPVAGFEVRCRTGLGREDLWARRDRVIAAHPDVTFILCHNGNDVGSVAGWAGLMERFPNVIGEISRDPLGADTVADVRAFCARFQDRLLFGTDVMAPTERPIDHVWTVGEVYRPWRTSLRAMQLDDTTLAKITWENGRQLFPLA